VDPKTVKRDLRLFEQLEQVIVKDQWIGLIPRRGYAKGVTPLFTRNVITTVVRGKIK
jgi:hypothetical protein